MQARAANAVYIDPSPGLSSRFESPDPIMGANARQTNELKRKREKTLPGHTTYYYVVMPRKRSFLRLTIRSLTACADAFPNFRDVTGYDSQSNGNSALRNSS